MKPKEIGIIAGIGVLAILLFSSASANGSYDLSSLNDAYGADNVQRLQNVANALKAAGLTDLQIKLCLSQILIETGLFTDNANLRATDQLNNYGGIMGAGGLKSYPTISAFVDDYIRILTKGADPLEASTVLEFNNRLEQNSYYGSDSTLQYLGNLNYYFNILSE